MHIIEVSVLDRGLVLLLFVLLCLPVSTQKVKYAVQSLQAATRTYAPSLEEEQLSFPMKALCHKELELELLLLDSTLGRLYLLQSDAQGLARGANLNIF